MPRDRTRRFTVGFGDGRRHIRILAADEKTKAWASRSSAVLQVALATFEEQVAPRQFASDRNVNLPSAIANVETIGSFVTRFAELLRRGFPEETFEVIPDVH